MGGRAEETASLAALLRVLARDDRNRMKEFLESEV